MPLDVGEVRAVLSARDTMTPAMAAAAENVAKLEYQLGTLGTTSVESFYKMNYALEQAQIKLNALRLAADSGAAGIDNVSKTSAAGVQQMANLEGMAMRVIERMALMWAIREAVTFIVDLYEAAEAARNLSDKLDLSVASVLDWEKASAAAGVTTEKSAAALDHFNKIFTNTKMASEDALESIGLSYDKLFKLSNDDRLRTVAEHVLALPTALQRSRAEFEIWGAGVDDAILNGFVKTMSTATEAANKMADETTRGMAQTVDSYKHLVVDAGSFIGDYLEIWTQRAAHTFGPFFGAGGFFNNDYSGKLPAPSGPGAGQTVSTGQDPDAYIQQLRDQQEAVGKLTDAEFKRLIALKEMNLLDTAHVNQLHIGTEAYKEFLKFESDEQKLVSEGLTKTKEWNRVLLESQQLGEGWRGTLATIPLALQATIVAQHAAGMSLSDLGKLWQQTPAQMEAMRKGIAETTEVEKKHALALLDIELISARIADITSKQDPQATERSAKAADIQLAYEREIIRLKKEKLNVDDMAALSALAAEKRDRELAGLEIDYARTRKNNTEDTRRGLQETADIERARYQDALQYIGVWSDSTIEEYRKTAEAAQRAADMFGTAYQVNAAKALGAVKVATASISADLQAMIDAGNAVITGFAPGTGPFMAGAIPNNTPTTPIPFGFSSGGLHPLVTNSGPYGGSTSITTNVGGLLLSNDPSSRVALGSMISDIVGQLLRENRKVGAA